MDGCDKIRESLALMECGALDKSHEAAVREHVAACPACAEYCRSIKVVCDDLRALDRRAEAAEPPDDLHKRVADALRASRPARPLSMWRAAAIAACLVIAAIGAYFALGQKERAVPEPVGAAGGAGITADAHASPNVSLPTLAVYHKAAFLSPEDLSAILDSHEVFRPRAEPGEGFVSTQPLPQAGGVDDRTAGGRRASAHAEVGQWNAKEASNEA